MAERSACSLWLQMRTIKYHKTENRGLRYLIWFKIGKFTSNIQISIFKLKIFLQVEDLIKNLSLLMLIKKFCWFLVFLLLYTLCNFVENLYFITKMHSVVFCKEKKQTFLIEFFDVLDRREKRMCFPLSPLATFQIICKSYANVPFHPYYFLFDSFCSSRSFLSHKTTKQLEFLDWLKRENSIIH